MYRIVYGYLKDGSYYDHVTLYKDKSRDKRRLNRRRAKKALADQGCTRFKVLRPGVERPSVLLPKAA